MIRRIASFVAVLFAVAVGGYLLWPRAVVAGSDLDGILDPGGSTMAGTVLDNPLNLTNEISHGFLVLSNLHDQPIFLVSVEPVNFVGSEITLMGSYVVPPGRPWGAFDVSNQFPPSVSAMPPELLRPLAGHELEPLGEAEQAQGGLDTEVVVHLRVEDPDTLAGYTTLCVKYRRAGSDQIREQCFDHGIFVCPVGVELEACDRQMIAATE